MSDGEVYDQIVGSALVASKMEQIFGMLTTLQAAKAQEKAFIESRDKAMELMQTGNFRDALGHIEKTTSGSFWLKQPDAPFILVVYGRKTNSFVLDQFLL
jgi:hypothetical protein